MRAVTRAEYAYTLDARELDWRIQVAEEMADDGFPEAALYYLRFWAYSLARIPMVWQSALEGKDIPFLRPERRGETCFARAMSGCSWEHSANDPWEAEVPLKPGAFRAVGEFDKMAGACVGTWHVREEFISKM